MGLIKRNGNNVGVPVSRGLIGITRQPEKIHGETLSNIENAKKMIEVIVEVFVAEGASFTLEARSTTNTSYEVEARIKGTFHGHGTRSTVFVLLILITNSTFYQLLKQ